MNNKTNTYTALNHLKKNGLKLVTEGVCVGLLSGAVVLLYRVLLNGADILRGNVYAYLKTHNNWITLIWFAAIAIAGCILGKMVKKEPLISGSGIIQVKDIVSRQRKINCLRIILYKLIGCTLAIGTGLSMGSGGPSIQMGATVGQGISRVFKKLKQEEKYLITGGASAGLAAVFNAPIAGVIFVLEDIHKHFSPFLLMIAMSSSITANYITNKLLGQNPIFNFSGIIPLPMNDYLYVIILGVILGILGWFFNWSLINSLNMFDRQKWLPKELKPILPVISAGVLGFVLPDALGGGHELIMSIGEGRFILTVLFLLVIAKFLLTMMSYGSGVPGGIFLPLLSIGALIGCIYGNIAVNFLHVDPKFISDFVILAMAGYFTAIVKAPLTGIILITEMTGSYSCLTALAIVSITAYLAARILNLKSVFDMLSERTPEGMDSNGDRQLLSIKI